MSRTYTFLLLGVIVCSSSVVHGQDGDGGDTGGATEEATDDDETTSSSASYDISARVHAVQEAAVQLRIACANDDVKSVLGGACGRYCEDSGSTVFNYCAFRSTPLAAAAVVVDFSAVRLALVEIHSNATSAHGRVAALPRQQRTATNAALTTLQNACLLEQLESATGPLSVATTRVLEVGMAALARLIQDRARRESIGWFLERIGEDVCGPREDDAIGTARNARAEIRQNWFPALCALSDAGRLSGYGAGAQLLRAFRAALEADVRRWPGAATGLAAGVLHYRDLAGATPNPFRCRPNATDPNCVSMRRFRRSVEAFVDTLVAGGQATTALEELSSELHDLNRRGTQALGVLSPSTQLFACAAAFPAALSNYATAFEAAGLSSNGSAEASAMVALGTAPACWPLVAGAGDNANTPRLRTLIRLYEGLRGATAGFASGVGRIRDTSERLRRLMRRGVQNEPRVLPDLEGVATGESVNEALLAFDAYVRRGENAPALHFAREVSGLVLEILSASLDITRSATSVFRSLSDAGMLDGFAARVTFRAGENFGTAVVSAQHYLETLQEASGLVAALVGGRWDTLVVGAGTIFQRLPPQSDLGDDVADSAGSKVTRYLGVLVALLSEDDPDALAELLDEVSEPVGGWRQKHEPGSFVLSLASFPGLWGGAEQRWGPYGAVLERGADVYAVAPTLSFPIGLDIAFGTPNGWSIGAFISVLDPVAFLQYDTSNGGALPGAQLLTVLAPGLGLRVGLPNTPFTVMPMVVYRPAFRTESSQVAGPGADVLQYGLLVSVDVTLFELHVSEAN